MNVPEELSSFPSFSWRLPVPPKPTPPIEISSCCRCRLAEARLPSLPPVCFLYSLCPTVFVVTKKLSHLVRSPVSPAIFSFFRMTWLAGCSPPPLMCNPFLTGDCQVVCPGPHTLLLALSPPVCLFPFFCVLSGE